MLNPRLSARYAKSLIDLALEQGKLAIIYADMQGLHNICISSPEFVALIKSPIVKGDKKQAILKSITAGKIDILTESFLNLVINKGREFYIPEIISSFIVLYKEKNNINDVVLTTAEAIDDEMKKVLESKIAKSLPGKTIDLKTLVDESLIGGFVLEANNNLFDASIRRDLKDIKKQFLNNEFIPNIR